MIAGVLILAQATTTTLCPEPGGISVHTGYQFGPRKDCHAVVEVIPIPAPPAHLSTDPATPTIGDQLCPHGMCTGGVPLLEHR